MDPDAVDALREEEVEGYIAECIAVLKVLNDQGSESFSRVRASFIADMDRLLELGRITPDEYNEVTNESNFSF